MNQLEAPCSLQPLKAYIVKHAPAASRDILQKLVDYYYVAVSREELLARGVERTYQALQSHFDFMRTRQAGQVKLRVFNPDPTVDGFESPYSVIQLTEDDMPFVVDSLLMELHRQGINIHFIVHNGAVPASRNSKGVLVDFKQDLATQAEANVHIEIDRQYDDTVLMALQDALFAVLSDVSLAVTDFLPMRAAVEKAAQHLQDEEAIAFLAWLLDNHFTFLGAARFNYSSKKKMVRDPSSCLGLMKDQSTYGVGCFSEELKNLPAEFEHAPILVSKSNVVATVHRPVYMDAILIREFNDKNECVGELHLVGLYTSVAYHSRALHIPYLRKKVTAVFERAHFAPHSHDVKALEDIIESMPKDQLFQMTEDQLYNTAMEILYIQERQQIRLFLHRDVMGRFYSCMVYLPRDLFNSELRVKFQNILMHALKGASASFAPLFLPSVLCRVDFMIRVQEDAPPDLPNIVEIEDELRAVARNWREDLKDHIIAELGEHQGGLIFNKYARAFPANYCDDFTVNEAYNDICKIEDLALEKSDLMIDFERDELEVKLLHFKAMQRHHGLWLAQILPILENFGLKVIEERPYEVRLPDNLSVWISDFLIDGTGFETQFDEVKTRFKEAFIEVWHKQAENDGFNRLTLKIGLNARQVVCLRAIAKYLAQIGFVYSQQYIEDTLCAYPELTQALIKLFTLKFALGLSEAAREEKAEVLKHFEQHLKQVTSLDHDRILRRFKEVIQAMLRTNYFQKNAQGEFKPCVSFKLNCSQIPELPKPVPLVEIFVYAPQVEGVHLRAAKVARGGIRWSDRREDFRTEVLGLMKAQQVKNAVIVPLGAKGGFYPKNLPWAEGRDAVQKEAISCYQIFIASLLDITDNIVHGAIVPPKDVVRYDEDDPYFVVAADKGTATFSDIANSVALEYQFWLGDAFASGGTYGYDHKKMGITARGAWESVKRHFLYMSKDIQKENFTVVGIGDMAGDVFGNGMLLSEHICLVAAFNHEHIFLDPNPKAAASFKERQRLFKLPRSSWADYNPKHISAGGGVFPRSLKTIPLSPEIQAVLGVSVAELEPNELIKAILRAPVELLWNGGIGTYIKASSQNHVDVGDRSNDALRIDANELRCKVVGEGGNLGVTQLGRIEFALSGGQICTDAIDNSAGVDCSDHEVNIKILLNAVLQEGGLTLDERNALLATMQDEVGRLVLSDNYHQTQLISNGVQQMTAATTYIRLLRELEREGFLNRSLEALPGDKVLKARIAQGKSFTKPEFSVLMAYAKTTIKKIILGSALPEEPYCVQYLAAEFPLVLSEKFGDAMLHHHLKREIIVTQLTNEMFQYLGIAYVHRMYDEVGASPDMSARAFMTAINIFDIKPLWAEIEALDGLVAAKVQIEMMNEITYFLQHQCRWLLRHYRSGLPVDALSKKLRKPCKQLFDSSRKYLNNDQKAVRDQLLMQYIEQGVPKNLADKIADFYYVYSILDVIHAAEIKGRQVEEILQMYYSVSYALGLSWLRQVLNQSAMAGYWEMLSASSLKDDLNSFQAEIVLSILEHTDAQKTAEERIEIWSDQYRYFVQRWHVLFSDFKVSQQEFFRITTLMNCMKDLVEVCRQNT
jgi:glutamate dehydrogenase